MAINRKVIWIELLRILACFCVVLLHVSAIGWKNAELGTASWCIFEVFNSVSRIGVCSFVMISGTLFLGNARGESIPLIYKKMFAKYLFAYFFGRHAI